jgi:serine protease Do
VHKAFFALLSLGCIVTSLSVFPIQASAQTRAPGYAEAENAFTQLNIDQRVKMQILLTAAGYWPAVPNVDFSTRLFKAICQYEADNGFVPLGIINNEQMDRLVSIGGSFLNRWGFESIRHPYPWVNSQIWVPLGLPVSKEVTSTGLKFINPSYGLVLTYDYYPDFNLRVSFESLLHKLERNGVRIYYSDLYRDEFFVLSYSDGITDSYVRYHQTGRSGVGITLYWNHDAADAHIERIATLISGSLWSSATGAPFTYPFTIKAPTAEVTTPPSPTPSPSTPGPGPHQEEPLMVKSGTGFFVTIDGRVVTNAHVIQDCSEIHVGTGQGNYVLGHLIATDPVNDLALLKVDFSPSHIGSLRFAIRLGETVEAFGYPLSQVLATSGNFTTGNVTALAGISDDSRYLQISAPIQHGNSGGPLLDENGNVVGIVTLKLNDISTLKSSGSVPQNVNFAIKASVAANFLQDNSVKFQIGEATQVMRTADLADQAKAISVFIECQ